MSDTAARGLSLRITEACRLFEKAADLAAPRLTKMAGDSGLSTINESRHLQPTFRAALEEVATLAEPRPRVSPRLSHGLKTEWPRLGNFDVSLAWADTTVFGELKCGETDLTLSACGWDASKEAFCLAHGFGEGMLLVAAAPVTLWEQRTLGLELFSDAEWDMRDIRARYAAGFRTWERDGYRPNYVFRRLRTFTVARTAPFLIGATRWLLGISRVEPVDEERMEWVPFLAEAT